MLWEDIKDISRNRDRCSQGREAVHAPPKCDTSPVPMMLQGLAKRDQTSDTNQPCRVYTPETVFWCVVTTVRLDVAVAEEVVEPMTPEFSTECANHRSKVDERRGCVAEQVWWGFNELGNRGDNADRPHSDPWKLN
jgi:hypothetical protein